MESAEETLIVQRASCCILPLSLWMLVPACRILLFDRSYAWNSLVWLPLNPHSMGFSCFLSCFDHISVPSTPEIHKPGAYSTNLRFQSQPSHWRFPCVWWCMFRWFESQFVTWHVDSRLLHYRLSTTTSEQGQAYMLYFLHTSIYIYYTHTYFWVTYEDLN